MFCLRRLVDAEPTALLEDNVWPSDFDTYEALLRHGLKAGKSARFTEPEDAKSLRWTVEDLAKARPGIRVSELAELVNVDMDLAETLARRAAREDGAVIDFDGDTW